MGHKFQGHPLLLESQTIRSEKLGKLLGGLKNFVLYIVLLHLSILQFIRPKWQQARILLKTFVCTLFFTIYTNRNHK